MNALHIPNILRTAQAVPFTAQEAASATTGICGRYNRAYLVKVLKARHLIRANLQAAIAGGHLLAANDHATLLHSVGVQAVILLRAGARTAH